MESISQSITKKGEQVILRSHPEMDNFFGRKAKQALFETGKITRLMASVFYMFDVLRSIRKYYHPKKSGTIIMIRYLMGIVYLPNKIVKQGYTFFEHFVPISRYMFFLDAPTSELMKRVQKREEIEIFETPEALDKVRNKALMLTKNWCFIDISGKIADTQRMIKQELERLDKNG